MSAIDEPAADDAGPEMAGPETADRETTDRETTGVTGRRAFLAGVGAAALAGIGAACTDDSNTDDSNTGGADGPESGSEPVRFRSEHQLGVLRAPSAAGLVAAFDIAVATRQELAEILQAVSVEAERIMAGAPPEPAEEILPPPDSGILGPDLGDSPGNVAITLGVGASLFDERFGLADRAPTELVRVTGRRLQLRWVQEGYNDLLGPDPARIAPTRNLMGFRDGTSNPETSIRACCSWPSSAR